MKPRPFYRWKSFWLGVFVLVFLGWSWARSMKHLEGVYWARPQFGLGLSHGVCAVTVSFADGDPSRWARLAPKTGVQSRRILPDMPIKWDDYRAVRGFSAAVNGVQSSGVKLAHWFLILLFFVPWSAWLFFHWKREQKKLRS